MVSQSLGMTCLGDMQSYGGGGVCGSGHPPTQHHDAVAAFQRGGPHPELLAS